MAVQLVTRVSDELGRSIDQLVTDGVFESRSELVRAGIEALIDRIRRERIGQAIVTGYLRVPQTDEGLWSESDTDSMISEEQW